MNNVHANTKRGPGTGAVGPRSFYITSRELSKGKDGRGNRCSHESWTAARIFLLSAISDGT
jgi:hypothetical protein